MPDVDHAASCGRVEPVVTSNTARLSPDFWSRHPGPGSARPGRLHRERTPRGVASQYMKVWEKREGISNVLPGFAFTI